MDFSIAVAYARERAGQFTAAMDGRRLAAIWARARITSAAAFLRLREYRLNAALIASGRRWANHRAARITCQLTTRKLSGAPVGVNS